MAKEKNVCGTDLQNSAQNGPRAFLFGVGRSDCGELIALHVPILCLLRARIPYIGALKSHFSNGALRCKVLRAPSAISLASSADPPSAPAPRTSGAPSLWPHPAPSRSALQIHPSAANWSAPPWSAPCTSPVGPDSVPAAVWPAGSPWLGSWGRQGPWDPRWAHVPIGDCALQCARTLTFRPPNSSFSRELVRSTMVRSLYLSRWAGLSSRGGLASGIALAWLLGPPGALGSKSQ